jgi:hypothetical protein
VIPTIPLGPRNRLAELIVNAIHDVTARTELEEIAASSTAPTGWLAENETGHAAALIARARAAWCALERESLRPRERTLEDTLEVAAALFDSGLGFEVHELLEPYWAAASGSEREALQGLIQIAVGYQHLANGNVAGAGSLLDEGSKRLAVGTLATLDLAAFARAVRADLTGGFPAGLRSASLAPPHFPRLTRAA